MSEPNRALGLHFFTAEDHLRDGPSPELCAPGYTAQINHRGFDLAGHKQFAASVFTAFPDLNHVIEDTVADEEKVAVRFVLHGTHLGPFEGIAPTGRRVAVEAIAILQIADGKVVELREVRDDAGLMRQLTS
jgi:steroid delta-isomerase-like uncharacterized protein